jgi:hypothetical protein
VCAFRSLPFSGIAENIATLATLVWGLGLQLAADRSPHEYIKCDNSVSVEILRAHQTAIYVSLCRSAEGDPLPRPVGGFLVTAKYVTQVNPDGISTHSAITDPTQVVIMDEYHITVRRLLYDPH